MRVLLINQTFWPDPQATGQYLADWARDLVRQGHEVTVLAGGRSYHRRAVRYPEAETWNGMTILRVWNAGFTHGSKWSRVFDFASFLLTASWRTLALRRFDAVVTLTTPPLLSVLGALLGWLWSARFLYWVMDLNPDEAVAVGWLAANGRPARFLETVSRWTMRRADAVIVLDAYMKERLLAKGIAKSKIETIPLWAQKGVTFDAAGREKFRAAHGLTGKLVVMYAGNHTPCHPLATLFDAALLLRNQPRIHFCFMGGGSEWDKLRRQAGKAGVRNMTFLGYQPWDQLPGSLSAADWQVVSMGDAFVGIVHPCKVYHFISTQRPFVYLGPERSHLGDLIAYAQLEKVTMSFRHGEASVLAKELSRRVGAPAPVWPCSTQEALAGTRPLEKMTSVLTSGRR